jgi:hypothetical protein
MEHLRAEVVTLDGQPMRFCQARALRALCAFAAAAVAAVR